MSNPQSAPPWRAVAILMTLYAAAYFLGAWLDLATTALALRHAGCLP